MSHKYLYTVPYHSVMSTDTTYDVHLTYTNIAGLLTLQPASRTTHNTVGHFAVRAAVYKCA